MSSIRINCQDVKSAVDGYQEQRQELASLIGSLQGVKAAGDLSRFSFVSIYNTLGRVIQNLEARKNSVQNLENGLEDIISKYADCENHLSDHIKASLFTETEADVKNSYDPENTQERGESILDNIILTLLPFLVTGKPIATWITQFMPTIPASILLKSGAETSTSSSGVDGGWFGYEFDEDNPGVTAWIGKGSAWVGDDSAYAGVNGYLGKGEAAAKADGGFMKNKTTKEYEDGKWTEKESFQFFFAEAGAAAGVSAAEGDASAGVGNGMLGMEGKVEGSALSASAEAKGKASVGEDGVNAYAEGKLMVSAVEGKASGTISILGFDITGEVGGYAGAAGVEGKIGIEDGKLVIKGGAAALIGGSAGIEIGINEEGWDNFVDFIDFITFWD